MAFDFKKEFKEFYMPKNKPEIVNVPKANLSPSTYCISQNNNYHNIS